MQLRGDAAAFIIRVFEGDIYRLSIHPYGCRIVQRIMEHCREDHAGPALREVRRVSRW